MQRNRVRFIGLSAMFRNSLLVLLMVAISACGDSSSTMDCRGKGEVSGGYQNSNDGALEYGFGLAWRASDGGYRVLFTRDALLADALRASPAPDAESHRVGQLLGELLVSLEFHADGNYHQRVTQGTSMSSGWSGADRGRISIDGDTCLRGDVKLDHYGSAHFALPLLPIREDQNAASTEVERDTRPAQNSAPSRVGTPEGALHIWQKAYARLHEPHPVSALQAAGFSAAVATVLAGDKRVKTVLARLRGQCPDPASANVNEYGEIVGTSHPTPDITLSGTGIASIAAKGAQIDNCYVMQRNGQSIDQCWPLTTDCTTAPLYDPN